METLVPLSVSMVEWPKLLNETLLHIPYKFYIFYRMHIYFIILKSEYSLWYLLRKPDNFFI